MDIVILLLSLIAGGCGYLVITFCIEPILRYRQHTIENELRRALAN